ncbi:MAG: Nucleolar GTP-binding protein 1 [Chrysothrix sp. TS-e1954]|nr:MAG: Nucleolar GTP-binding protein 1 [Chrysothrix sp. TS-e1954]
MKTTWKDIAPVPTSQEFIDIVLSRTQRRLPTQIRAGFKQSRIRSFYIRKVKYTAETFTEKFEAIITSFPRLQDIHPFHKDLLNTLYDADAFKRSLGAVSTAKGLCETVSRDYVRLLKYGQSLYQCKQLKRAALGRMATICRRLRDPLIYLEQVRQHLGRLPSIDPNTRTLLIAGFPNVGKSSFLQNISHADTAVEPYAFTTKSLFVGHFDYKLLRFQAIDTPGVLDHPLEEMNTIEMQAITAIAHLRSAILYFMDLSEQCGYPVSAQIALFNSIKPLFANKLVFIVVNKIDLMKPEDLDATTQQDLQSMINNSGAQMLQLSCTTTENIMAVRNTVCDHLLAERNAQKLKASANSSSSSTDAPAGRLGDLLKRIHVAQPLGGIVRDPFIPAAAINRQKPSTDDPDRPLLERDIEASEGGPGVYSLDMKKNYLSIPSDQIHDTIPEVYNGKNVADFIDADIAAKLAALEAEEERLETEGFYDVDDTPAPNAADADVSYKADLIREKRMLIRNEAKQRKSLKNRAIIPRSLAKPKSISQMETSLQSAGYDTTRLSARARSQSRGRAPSRGRSSVPSDAMDVDSQQDPRAALLARSKSRGRSQSTNRRDDGVPEGESRGMAEKLQKLGQKRMNRMARQGEADRHTSAKMPKHLYSGKRGIGKNQRR